ncbi:unnamed protein product [Microthlaspi erraticum]|uniref:Reverse transcriptase domain-containing protein n=1 Tax=Microthlaspi erraticum TaxID=1685480 RepID=A0A6D2ISB9_9BRAS|nr:unnamed protein product [Microthlaspi erraticum]
MLILELIAKKLDKILINDKWLLNYPSAYAHFGNPEFSDHSPSCIIFGDRLQTKRHFMVSNFLLHHPDFLPRVAIKWQEMFFAGSAMVKEAHSRLLESQGNLLVNPTHLLAIREKETHKTWHTLSLAEERFLQQRSRVKWLESGDGNTAFFHKMVAQRRSTNQIHYLINSEGRRLDKIGEVKSHCVEYFQDLFGAPTSPLLPASADKISDLTKFRCSDQLKELLKAEVTAADVKFEVFSLPRNKTPGPDGYTGEFYRKSWDIVGHDIIKAVLEFFRSGQMLKQWNCTAISLIPKRVGADKLVDFRPISLCNVVYKIISKILARRLQEVTPSMVTNSQSAFVKGRLLVDNVLLATEMVQGFQNSNITKRGLLKVDLRKAFDCVNWDFILHILLTADFPPLFVNWISQCLTTSSFSISVNGDLCGFFKGTRGLRQGDPLSPSLFVIAMEAYSNLLTSAFDSCSIGYHPLGRNPKITHLAFVDDIVIFFDGKGSSLQGISSTLEDFKQLSGLCMNREKTDLFLAGLNPEESEALNIFGFQKGSLPIRYLGLPLLHRKLRKADYSPLTDKIKAKFNSWTVKGLTFAGRLQLISSVIYSLVNFWFSAFSLPKGCLKDIEKLCNKFLWAGDLTKHTSAKISWKGICLPKSEGGLGLRNFLVWNKVLNLKLVWLLFSNTDSLWVAWTLEHRLKRNFFWTIGEKSTDSWIWKFLISLRPLARNLFTSSVGDGTMINLWYDNWCVHGPLIHFVGENGPRLMGIPVQASLTQAYYSHDWNARSRTRNLKIAVLRSLLQTMQPPSPANGADTFLWGPPDQKSTNFSTKKTWDILRPRQTEKRWFKAVWFKKNVPKHAFNFWATNLDRLPLNVRLAKWGLNVNPVCTICHLHDENRDHRFLHCEFSSQVWTLIMQRLGFHSIPFHNWEELIQWMLSSTRQPKLKFLRNLVCQATIYILWRERNSRNHGDISVTTECMLRQKKLTIVFQTDCSDMVKMVSKPDELPAFATILEELCRCRTEFTSFSIVHIPRTKNTKADKLARSARVLPTDVFCVNSVSPAWIPQLV